ncbi:TonB-dependent receptor [Tardiphaga alba]|uniref:TonB-dependent receptor n=1 Tax=Tardiphaga alba TaxID=340268 RepID=A0ABX8A5F1_9BRAD|nr:TonB-dependent receptor [Tardiphaga alba]QUS37615.1 TonB-dependent receptor [Tardiphaga alba]
MNFSSKTFLATTALVSLAFPAAAQNAVPLNEIIVQGTLASSVQTANDLRRAAPNSKIIIEAEQLNQFNDQSVGDAIRRLPGVTFPRVNRSRDIKLRGLGKEYTQVLLDGRPIIDGDSSRNMEVDRIPTIFVERIEITRSPLASQDSQGSAGTINIITKRNFGPSGGGISLGAGHVENFGTAGDASGWTGGQTGPVKYFIGGGYQRRLLEESNNTYNYTGAAGTTPNRATIQDQKRTFDEYTALGRFEFKANDVNTFTVAPTYLKTEERRAQSENRTNTAMTFVDRNTTEVRNRVRENYGSYFEWAQTHNNFVSSKIFADVQQAREDTARDSIQTSYNATGIVTGVVPGYTFNPVTLTRVAPGAAVTTQWDGHTFESGMGLNRLTRGENDGGRADGSRTYDIREDVYYGYLSDSFSILGTDKLTAAVRVEHSNTATTDFRGLETERTETNLNPSLNYKIALAQDTDLRAGIARTVRRPDLRDLTPTVRRGGGTPGDPDTRGNPNAVPEKVWGADLGVDHYFYHRLGILSANVFARNFEDKLERRLTQGYTGEPTRWISDLRNAGNGNAYGLELEGRIPLRMLSMPNLTLWSNATLIKTELTDPQTLQTRRFAEQPDAIVNVGLDYYVEAWRTTFGLNYNRSFAYSQDILQTGTTVNTLFNQRTEYNALNRLDFSMKIALTPNASISFSALNLTRPLFRTRQTTYSPAGVITNVANYEEPSHSLYYVRTSFTW